MGLYNDSYSLLGEYNNNWKSCVYESTDIIFKLLKNPNHEVMYSRAKNLLPGKFYLMKYEYISDKYFTEKYMERTSVPSIKIWCPIFTLGFNESEKIVDRYNKNKKSIMYAINLDYLPYKYRINLFNGIFDMNKDRIDKNSDINFKGENCLSEMPLKIKASSMYNILKLNGNYEFSLTAYDPDKINRFTMGNPELYTISTTIAQRFMFIDCKLANRGLLMESYKSTEIDTEREKIKKILKSFDEILNDLESNERELYKKLRLLENHFKLFKD